MRKVVGLLLLFSLLTFGKAFSQEDEEFEYTFRIQVAASKTTLSTNSKLYQDLPNVEAIKLPGSEVFRYFVGKYETFHRAKDALETVKTKGYKDAYVICINKGRLLSADQAISEIYGDD